MTIPSNERKKRSLRNTRDIRTNFFSIGAATITVSSECVRETVEHQQRSLQYDFPFCLFVSLSRVAAECLFSSPQRTERDRIAFGAELVEFPVYGLRGHANHPALGVYYRSHCLNLREQ